MKSLSCTSFCRYAPIEPGARHVAGDRQRVDPILLCSRNSTETLVPVVQRQSCAAALDSGGDDNLIRVRLERTTQSSSMIHRTGSSSPKVDGEGSARRSLAGFDVNHAIHLPQHIEPDQAVNCQRERSASRHANQLTPVQPQRRKFCFPGVADLSEGAQPALVGSRLQTNLSLFSCLSGCKWSRCRSEMSSCPSSHAGPDQDPAIRDLERNLPIRPALRNRGCAAREKEVSARSKRLIVSPGPPSGAFVARPRPPLRQPGGKTRIRSAGPGKSEKFRLHSAAAKRCIIATYLSSVSH